MYDAVKELSYYLLKVNGNTPDEPVPYPRPGTRPPTPEPEASLTDFNTLLRS